MMNKFLIMIIFLLFLSPISSKESEKFICDVIDVPSGYTLHQTLVEFYLDQATEQDGRAVVARDNAQWSYEIADKLEQDIKDFKKANPNADTSALEQRVIEMREAGARHEKRAEKNRNQAQEYRQKAADEWAKFCDLLRQWREQVGNTQEEVAEFYRQLEELGILRRNS
jgi:hypothetical protein